MKELAIRRYTKDGVLHHVTKHKGLDMHKCKAFICALFGLGTKFGHETIAPLNLCNVSVRGPNGKFVKWK